MQMSVGELFILGFYGKVIPAWLKDFAMRFGLGGVILFDYSCQTRQYDNNIASPAQLQALCAEIASLPSRPLVFIDQEGGLVRRPRRASAFSRYRARRISICSPPRRSAKSWPQAMANCAGLASATILRR